MNRLNPNFVVLFAFLLVGLIWSGGHIGWLIALGILTLIGIVGP